MVLDPKTRKTLVCSDNLIRELTGQSDPESKLSLQIPHVWLTFSYIFYGIAPTRVRGNAFFESVRAMAMGLDHRGQVVATISSLLVTMQAISCIIVHVAQVES